MSHTEGPWKFDGGVGCKAIKGGKAGRHKQAQYRAIAHTDGLFNDEEDTANARLIAAAPDLLEALAGMLVSDNDTHRESDDRWSIFRRAAHAAIAKAKPNEAQRAGGGK